MPGAKGDWRRQRAKDQLAVAQQAFDQKKYKLALQGRAAGRSKVWPLSDYAPQAQYLIGRCYEERKQDEKAFNAYETLLVKYPKSANADEVQQRQFVIAVRFLHGQWFKILGHIPFFPSMDKTAEMFEKIVRYGPYGEFGPGFADEHRRGAGEAKGLPAGGQGLRIGGRPLQRPETSGLGRALQSGPGLHQTGPQGGLRPKHGRAGHFSLHRFHGALS